MKRYKNPFFIINLILIMGCQEPNDDKTSTMPEEVLYNTENILVDINEKIYNNDESVKALSLIHISEPTRPLYISYAVFCLTNAVSYTHLTLPTTPYV